jgi:hypothetical protein
MSCRQGAYTDRLVHDDWFKMNQKSQNPTSGLPPAQGLYDPAHEHDACGIGFVASIRGEKSHDIIKKGIQVLKPAMGPASSSRFHTSSLRANAKSWDSNCLRREPMAWA